LFPLLSRDRQGEVIRRLATTPMPIKQRAECIKYLDLDVESHPKTFEFQGLRGRQ